MVRFDLLLINTSATQNNIIAVNWSMKMRQISYSKSQNNNFLEWDDHAIAKWLREKKWLVFAHYLKNEFLYKYEMRVLLQANQICFILNCMAYQSNMWTFWNEWKIGIHNAREADSWMSVWNVWPIKIQFGQMCLNIEDQDLNKA